MSRHRKGIISGLLTTVSFLTIITVISKLLGLLREVGIASSFDNITTDALYVALIIPALLFTSIGVALQNLFMIEFTAVKNESIDKENENRLSSNLANILLVFAVIIFIISFIFTPVIIKLIAPGFVNKEKFDLTVKLTRILLPTIVILPLYQIRSSMLRVYNRFVTVAFIDLGFNIFQIVYLFLFADRFGIVGLTYSILFAYVFQLLLIEFISFRMGFRIKAILNFNDKHIKIIFRLFVPTLISFLVIQLNTSIDKVIASSLGDGAISALNYGFMIRTVIYSVSISVILLIVYPVLLRHKNNNDMDNFNKVGTTTFKMLILLTLPFTLILMGFNKSIVRVIFERGEFTSSATLVTSKVLFFYAIGITFYAIKEFLVLVSYSYKNTKLPLFITIISAVLSVCFSLVLKIWFGVYGIALGLALSEFISAVILIIYIIKYNYLDLRKAIKDLFIVLLVNIIIGVILFIIKGYLYIPIKKIFEFLIVGAYGVVLLVVYLIVLRLLKVNVIQDFLVFVRGDVDV